MKSRKIISRPVCELLIDQNRFLPEVLSGYKLMVACKNQPVFKAKRCSRRLTAALRQSLKISKLI